VNLLATKTDVSRKRSVQRWGERGQGVEGEGAKGKGWGWGGRHFHASLVISAKSLRDGDR
jgi:hypothetical protein